MKIKSQVKVGAFLSYVILGVTNIVGLLYTPYMLRMMGKSEYGLYSLVASVIAYLTILDFGFGNTVIRYTAKFRSEGKVREQFEMFGMFIILYSIIGAIAFVLGLNLYFNVDNLFEQSMTSIELERARIMMLLMVFNVAITFPFSIFSSIITAHERYVFSKSIQIARILLNTIVMVVLLHYGYRAIAMVIVTTIFNILTLGINFWYCKRVLNVKIIFGRFDKVFIKELALYSFYIFLGFIIDRIYWSTGQFVLGVYVGTAAVATFAIAIQLKGMFMNFSTAISGVFLPRVTAMVTAEKNKKSISDLFIKTGRVQFIILSFVFCGFLLFGKSFIILWAGSDYEESYLMVLLFFIALFIPLIQNLGITILQARNQMKFRTILYICIAVLSLVMQIPLAKSHGGLGVAVAVSFALILGNVIVMNVYYQKKQDLDIVKFWKELFRMAISPVIVTLLYYGITQYVSTDEVVELIGNIIAFSIIYLFCFWRFSMNEYEKKLFKDPMVNMLKRIKNK